MRHLILASTLLAPIAAHAESGMGCAILPPQHEVAAPGAQSQPQPTIALPPPVNPQALVAKYMSKPGLSATSPPPPIAPVHIAAPATVPTPAQPAAPLASVTGGQPMALSNAEISRMPALRRIASAGATLLDLGTTHGMRTIFARKNNAFQVFYLVPDGSAVIGGIMWDSSGHDVTRDQVAPIPGVIPTVKIGPTGGQPTATPTVDQTARQDAINLVKETTYGTIGPADAPHLWMFIDPFCAFSVRAMQQLEPYVQSGKLQLSVIPLSVLDYEDQGRSTPAAQIMVSEPPGQMVTDWVNGSLTGTVSGDAGDLLSRNMAVAAALHLRGTPTMIWQNLDGSTGRSDGIPPDLNAVLSSIGS